jgi:putative hydrolase of the HAD superfamily
MTPYPAVIFDLFGTLVHFDSIRLPLFNYRDEAIHCTTIPLYEAFSEYDTGVTIECFHQTLMEIILRFRKEKAAHLREISCLTRMQTLLNELQFPQVEKKDQVAFLLKETHMSWMKKCVYLPEGTDRFLEKLRPLRVGLLSNFDDSATGYRILEELGLTRHFQSVLFSDDAGMVKPHRQLFSRMTREMNVRPSEILFVGDTPEADIWGAKRSGMAAAWINPGEAPFPGEKGTPDFEIRNVTELEPILFNS